LPYAAMRSGSDLTAFDLLCLLLKSVYRVSLQAVNWPESNGFSAAQQDQPIYEVEQFDDHLCHTAPDWKHELNALADCCRHKAANSEVHR
ncbi:MAG: hypothetical protein JWN30_2292, partial [Bacilli bacterium]|nr:hypothetical protein [Bacilli bacterium]